MPINFCGGGGIKKMILGRCIHCNYTARYNSNYFTIPELKKHIILFPLEKWECNHSMTYEEKKSSNNLTRFLETNHVEVTCN